MKYPEATKSILPYCYRNGTPKITKDPLKLVRCRVVFCFNYRCGFKKNHMVV